MTKKGRLSFEKQKFVRHTLSSTRNLENLILWSLRKNLKKSEFE